MIIALATKNPCYKKGTKMTPKGLLLHSTGANNPYLKRYVDAPEEVGVNKYNNTWNSEDASVCVHGFIGYDINGDVKAAQTLPFNMACWGCGRGSKGSYNYDPTGHIQFEICEDGLDNELYFKQCWQVAVETFADLCLEYGFDPLTQITSHYEAHAKGYASNHADPRHWFSKFGVTMDDFREDVKELLDKWKNEDFTEDGGKLYKVQTGAFKNRANAEKLLAKLKAAGFEGFIKVE